MENYHNGSVLCCVWQLCTMIRAHDRAVLTVDCLVFRFFLGSA